MRRTLLGAVLLSAALLSQLKAEPKVSGRPITIRAIEGLQFDPPRSKMDPGQTVLFRFLNRDPSDQPHNFIIIKPGSLEAIQKASLQIDADSITRGYIPEHEAVLASTKLLIADQSEEFIFTAPEEPGIYHYVCTYPGHSMVMYGALYVGQKYGSIEKDQNIPQFARDRAVRLAEAKKAVTRPKVRRLFMKEVGPAAIAVALENDMNYCWDAGNCRLRYTWSGDFIDEGDTSRSNGNRQAGIKGEKFWDGSGNELTYTIKFDDPEVKPDFKGYRLIDGKPEFKYTIGGLEVTEFITSTPDGIENHINVANAKEPVKIYTKGNIAASAGKREGDYLVVEPGDATELKLTISAK
ncbi:MAG: hypothetical protein P1U89_21500 [Verrucomicrobiales bacterium]|nr:hypothetical protein [Verrucomicrobiales bacterium]